MLRLRRPRYARLRHLLAGFTTVASLAAVTACSSPAGQEQEGLAGAPVRSVTGWVAVDDSRTDVTGELTWSWPVAAKVCDVVLEVPANTRPSAANGTWAEVDQLLVNGAEVEVGGSGDRLVAELGECVNPGERFDVGVRFRAHAGAGGNERIGHHNGTTWWGSVLPRPAWSTLRGWHTPIRVAEKGEGLTTPVFNVADLKVTTPAGVDLAAQGTVKTTRATGGRVTHTVVTDGVRDVAFVTGNLTSVRAGGLGCEAVGVTTSGPGAGARAAAVAREAVRGLVTLKGTFRFCPYPVTRVVAVQPGYGGMEFPGLVVVADHDPRIQPRLVAHEMAHQFFYGFIGSDQGRHPWLDEAFSTWGESLINPATGRDLDTRAWPDDVAARVGEPMTYWNGRPHWYSTGVYARGAAAIREARRVAGPGRFDEALRNWAARCGQSICGPQVLREELREAAPKAVGVLDAAGAWTQVP